MLLSASENGGIPVAISFRARKSNGKKIAKRYDGLANLGDKRIKWESFEISLDEVVWRITLPANQSVLVHNLQNPEDKRALLTEEDVGLLTSPPKLVAYKKSIMEAMFKGAKREAESEDDSKNAAFV